MKLDEVTRPKKSATAPKSAKKGNTKEIGGKTYRWEGALWVDTATNKPIGVANAMKMGLGNPKLDPIIAAAKKDPALSKLIKQQITAKGIKAGTAQAAKAAQPSANNKATPKVTPTAKKTKATPKVKPATKVTGKQDVKKDSKLKKAAGAVKSGYKNYNKMSALNPGS